MSLLLLFVIWCRNLVEERKICGILPPPSTLLLSTAELFSCLNCNPLKNGEFCSSTRRVKRLWMFFVSKLVRHYLDSLTQIPEFMLRILQRKNELFDVDINDRVWRTQFTDRNGILGNSRKQKLFEPIKKFNGNPSEMGLKNRNFVQMVLKLVSRLFIGAQEKIQLASESCCNEIYFRLFEIVLS